MAAEITVSGSVRCDRYNATFEVSKVGLSVDQSGTNNFHGVQNIGTSEEQIQTGEVTPAQCWIFLRNMDSTNFIELRLQSAGVKFCKLKANEFALFRLGSGLPGLWAIADTAACNLEYMIFDEGASAGGGSTDVSIHTLLDGDMHSDTTADTPTLGEVIYANSTPKWAALAGNTTATKKLLTQTGTGAVSA